MLNIKQLTSYVQVVIGLGNVVLSNTREEARMPEATAAADKQHHLAAALQRFKNAAVALSSAWERCDDDDLIAEYPDYLPGFDEFRDDLLEMRVKLPSQRELPSLPPVGTILRARYDLDIAGNFRAWPKGWAGEVVTIDKDHVHVRCFRYLGPGVHEWNNCRVLGLDDGMYEFEDRFGKEPGGMVADEALLALALDREFEKI